MKLDRTHIKSRIDGALLRAYSERSTVNVIIARGLNEMVDAICDELEKPADTKKKAS